LRLDEEAVSLVNLHQELPLKLEEDICRKKHTEASLGNVDTALFDCDIEIILRELCGVNINADEAEESEAQAVHKCFVVVSQHVCLINVGKIRAHLVIMLLVFIFGHYHVLVVE